MKKTVKALAFILCIATASLYMPACSRERTDVHVFYYTYSDPYISTVRSALDKRLREAGISYQDYDGNNSQTTQTEQIQTAVTKGAKAIIVNIVTTGSDDAANGIVTLAKNANIPIIFFNREVSDEVVQSYEKCSFVGTNAKEAGYLQGDMIGEYLVNNYDNVDLNRDGKISYVMFMGEKGNNEAIYRTTYSVENANKRLTEAGKPELVFYDSQNTDKYLLDKDGKWSAQAANEYMTTLLTSYNVTNRNMVECIICNNDGMAEGAISALSAAGFNTGLPNSVSIPVFGVDATSAAKELINAGKMSGTIKQDSDGMAEAIEIIIKNSLENKSPTAGLDKFTTDSEVNKIRIPYSVYTGEKN